MKKATFQKQNFTISNIPARTISAALRRCRPRRLHGSRAAHPHTRTPTRTFSAKMNEIRCCKHRSRSLAFASSALYIHTYTYTLSPAGPAGGRGIDSLFPRRGCARTPTPTHIYARGAQSIVKIALLGRRGRACNTDTGTT